MIDGDVGPDGGPTMATPTDDPSDDGWLCPECGAGVANCQGIRACPGCGWTGGR